METGLLLFVAVFLLPAAVAAGSVQPPPEIPAPAAEVLRGTSVKLLTSTTVGTGYASGLIVSDDGFVLTNAHAVRCNQRIEAFVHVLDRTVRVRDVFALDDDLDLALVRLQLKRGDGPFEEVETLPREPDRGERVHGWGATTGFRSGTFRWADDERLDVAIESAPGDSGGALLNDEGFLVGVLTTGRIGRDESLGHRSQYIPGPAAATWIEEARRGKPLPKSSFCAPERRKWWDLRRALHYLDVERHQIALDTLEPYVNDPAGGAFVARVQVLRASALVRLRRMQPAREAVEAALDAAPLDSRARLFASSLAFRGGDLGAAKAHVNGLLGRYPGHPDALGLRATILLKEGRLEDALADLEAILQVSDDNVRVVHNRGAVRLLRNDVAGAKADFQTVLGRDERSGRAWHCLGLALALEGEVEAALLALFRATDVGWLGAESASQPAMEHLGRGAPIHELPSAQSCPTYLRP